MKSMIRAFMVYLAALPLALAQSSDSAGADGALGAERARLANQRIQAEAEMRAREEQRRLEEEAQARLRAEQAAARSEIAAAQYSRPEVPAEAGSAEVAAARNTTPEAVETAGSGDLAAARSAQPDAVEAARGSDMQRILEQLRLLGELKDAGYVTEDEFQRIKQRILNDRL